MELRVESIECEFLFDLERIIGGPNRRILGPI